MIIYGCDYAFCSTPARHHVSGFGTYCDEHAAKVKHIAARAAKAQRARGHDRSDTDPDQLSLTETTEETE